MPLSAHYIFIRSPGLASDTEVIKCLGAIRAALSALKQSKEATRPVGGRNKSISFLKEPAGSFLGTGCPAHITIWEKVEKHTQRGKIKSKQASPPLVPRNHPFKGPYEWWGKGKDALIKERTCQDVVSDILLSLVLPFREVAKDPPHLTSSNRESARLHPNFFQPELQQPDATGGHPDAASPKHNHSNPGCGCLEVNIHGPLIRNIWPPKRVDTAQAGSSGFVGGTQSYRG